MAAEEAIKATVDELLKALSAKKIMGGPIETEDKIIIPITKMGMGFGAGSAHEANGSGGAGGGVGVFPVAVVILFKGVAGPERVNVVPLTGAHSQAEPMTNIAHLFLEKLIGHKEGGEKKPGHVASIDIE
jgi:uncharacterized spore protein YtfJ